MAIRNSRKNTSNVYLKDLLRLISKVAASVVDVNPTCPTNENLRNKYDKLVRVVTNNTIQV